MSVPALGHWAFANGILTALGERIQPLIRRPWLPAVINLAALALLASGLAQWTWQVFTPTAPAAVVPAATAPAMSNTATFNLPALQAAHLFGTSAGAANLDQIPISSLNLVLTGLVAGAKDGFALIRVDGQAEAPFAVGQEVVSGAILQAVYADRAIIFRAGMQESLLLEGAPSPAAGSTFGPPAPVAARPPSRPQPQQPPITPPSSAIQEQAPNQYAVQRAYIEAQMRTPQQLLSQALIVPYNSGGFLVREINPGSMYEYLGLRVGDVIRRVNGQELTSMEDVMKAYQQFNGQAQVKLQVLRQGRLENLLYIMQ